METNNIKLTSEGTSAIDGLRHKCGTLKLYKDTLTRIYNQVLYVAEDLGMDAAEAIETLRTLDMLRCDLDAIAKLPDDKPAVEAPENDIIPAAAISDSGDSDEDDADDLKELTDEEILSNSDND